MARRGAAGSSNATADGEVRVGLADLVLEGACTQGPGVRTNLLAGELVEILHELPRVQAEHGALQQRTVYYTPCAYCRAVAA